MRWVVVFVCLVWTVVHAKYTSDDPQLINHLLNEKLSDGKLLCNCSEMSGCGVALTNGNTLTGVCITEGGCMKAIARDQHDHTKLAITYTCVEETSYHPRARPLVCNVAVQDTPWRNYYCCHNASFCASNVHLQLTPIPDKFIVVSGEANRTWMVPVIVVIVVILLVVSILTSYYFIKRFHFPAIFPRTQKPQNSEDSRCSILQNRAEFEPAIENLKKCVEDLDTTSGTGAGAPLITLRTIAREITMGKQIGEGRYGKVYYGTRKGDPVAVKIFSTRDEASYYREVSIFTTYMLSHNNILRFIAADNIDRGASTQLWIITEYQPNGSLYDYLSRETLHPRTLCTMARSIAQGLVYLHHEARTDHGTKPAIAHRDLKTKNVLVKPNLECAIGDLGLALRDVIDMADPNIKSGTKRYQPPEVLDGTLNTDLFEDYIRGDIYCLGLIMWEMGRRTKLNGMEPLAYELPYYEHVPMEPTEEDMRQCVCVKGIRPSFPEPWEKDPLLNRMSVLMRECWTRNQAARLPVLRVKKDLQNLEEGIKNIV